MTVHQSGYERPNLFGECAIDEIPGGNAPWPIIIRRSEEIGLKRAEDLVGWSAKTIKRYCRHYGVGMRSVHNGPWIVSAPALLMLKHNDLVALELLRRGRRDHSRVARYFDEVGVPV